jgi:hypothetical protein
MTNLTIKLYTPNLASMLGTVLESVREGDEQFANVWMGTFERGAATVHVRGRDNGELVFKIDSAGVAILHVHTEYGSWDTHVLGRLTLRNIEAKAFEIYRIATANSGSAGLKKEVTQ